MTGLKNEVIARYTYSGHKFEIIVDPEKVQQYKENENIPLSQVIIGDSVFTDISKAERAKDELLLQVFKTKDIQKISEHIIRHGEIQHTAEQRRAALEQKRKKIVTYISRHAIDPRTKLPHPPQRIESALEQAKVRIDPFKKAEDQINEVIKQLRTLIPLSIESRTVAFKIPVRYAGTLRTIMAKSGKMLKDEWSGEYWFAEIEIPAGMLDELFSRVNAVTHGENESKIVEK